jgi:hypothetical protein
MEKIPIVICIDVEPDARVTDPNVAIDWAGFEKTFEFYEQLRPHLQDATQSLVHFSWFVRMDPQIADTYGSPDWAIARYRRLFDRMEAAGDDIGLHTHAWRWEPESNEWIADMGDQEWVDHCVQMAFAAFEQSMNRKCQSFRFGDHWMNDATLALVERLGARFDLTVEPGRKELSIPERYTGSPPDYSQAPQQPYRPSKLNFTEHDAEQKRELWAVPLSTCDADQLLKSLTEISNGNGCSYTEKLKVWALSRRSTADYEGFLDRADYEAIRGWAYDARRPDRPLEIQIYDGQVLLTTVLADGLRPDLLLAGKGNGRHSFALPTPSCLRDGRSRSIRAKAANGNFELNNSPRTMTADRLPLFEGGVIHLHPSADPWLMSRTVNVLLGSLGQRYLALSVRSQEVLNRWQLANTSENFNYLLSHPLVKNFVIETPAELVARLA